MSKKNSFFRLEMLFLKVLDRKDCYGYEITHSLKEITHGKIDVKEGLYNYFGGELTLPKFLFIKK